MPIRSLIYLSQMFGDKSTEPRLLTMLIQAGTIDTCIHTRRNQWYHLLTKHKNVSTALNFQIAHSRSPFRVSVGPLEMRLYEYTLAGKGSPSLIPLPIAVSPMFSAQSPQAKLTTDSSQ